MNAPEKGNKKRRWFTPCHVVGCLGVLASIPAHIIGICLIAVGLHGVMCETYVSTAAAAKGVGGLVLVITCAVGVPLYCRIGFAVGYRELISAAGNFFLAGLYMAAWVCPTWLGEGTVVSMVGMLLVEFPLIHSGLILGHVLATEKRSFKWAMSLGGLAIVYLAFAAGISVLVRRWAPVLALLAMLVNKVGGVLVRSSGPKDLARETPRWVMSAVYYLGAVFLSMFWPFPRLGITGHISRRALWLEDPHQAVAAGTIYFLWLAFYELFWAQRYEQEALEADQDGVS